MSPTHKRKNLALRIVVALFVIISVALFHQEFYQQFECYFKGKANVVTGEWHITVLNVLLFLLLLLPLSFRRKAHWGQYGIVTAFFVSLFIEMYGFPLTIYFASKYFSEPVVCAESVLDFKFWGVHFGMETAMIFTSILIFIGTLLIIVGWATLYKNSKKGGFVESGIYKYSRHPQYLGFILVVIGWLIDWPTLITIIFAPLLVYAYVRVCITEEKEILKEHPEYQDYIDRVPMFF